MIKKITGLGGAVLFVLGIEMYYPINSNEQEVLVEVAIAPSTEIAAVIKTPEETTKELTVEVTKEITTEEKVGVPKKLIIPSIGINSSIESLGLTSSGAMDVPKGPDNVSWYNLGPYPGEGGSAVLAGHSGWKDSIPAVFDHLNSLKIGDKIEIVNNNGDSTFFIVTGSQLFDANADTTDIFSSADGKHLNLITCTGVWNPVSRTSAQRLVIFTDKVK